MITLKLLAQSSIKEVVEIDYPSISHSENVSKLIALFQGSGSYEALVTNGHPPRIVTVRDILKVIHPRRTSVSKIAFMPPSISPDISVYDASVKLVQKGIRILPVVENKSVTSVVRQTRILEKMTYCDDLKEFVAEEFMVGDPITVGQDSSVGIVRSIMVRREISHAPVVNEEGNLKGILTAKDIVGHYVKPRESMRFGGKRGEKIRLMDMGIGGLTDRNPLLVTRKTSLLDVVREMVASKKNYSLVVEKHKPVGIITPRDVMSLLVRFRPQIHLPVYMVGFGGQEEGLVQSAKRKIERVAIRGLKMHPDMQEVVIHGKMGSARGKRKRFTVKVRVYTPLRMLAVNAEGLVTYHSL